MTNTRGRRPVRASFAVGMLLLASCAASCSSPSDAPARAERITRATGKLRFQLDNADGVAVANQNLLVVLQGMPGELSDAASLPDHVEVSWLGDFGAATSGVHWDALPKFDLRLTAPGRAAWIPTRVLEVESGKLGQVELDVGPEFAGRRLTVGVSAAFEKWPIHWIGAVEPNAAGTDVELVHLELLDRIQRPPAVSKLDDTRLARLIHDPLLRTRNRSTLLRCCGGSGPQRPYRSLPARTILAPCIAGAFAFSLRGS